MDIKSILKKVTPRLYRRLLRERNAIRLFSHLRESDVNFGLLANAIKKSQGTYDVECSLCGFVGCFGAFGSPPRYNAVCPSCGSLERHRLLALVLLDMPLSGNVLHFAPENCVAAFFEKKSTKYITADLYKPDVDLKLNIEKIDLT